VYFAKTAAERDSNEQTSRTVPVATMVLESKSADYVRPVLPEQDPSEPFLYLAYLLTDRATENIRKGASASLIAHAKTEARRLGLRRICMDCWSGNGGKLVRYVQLPTTQHLQVYPLH
jgi:hypothetical protein